MPLVLVVLEIRRKLQAILLQANERMDIRPDTHHRVGMSAQNQGGMNNDLSELNGG